MANFRFGTLFWGRSFFAYFFFCVCTLCEKKSKVVARKTKFISSKAYYKDFEHAIKSAIISEPLDTTIYYYHPLPQIHH